MALRYLARQYLQKRLPATRIPGERWTVALLHGNVQQAERPDTSTTSDQISRNAETSAVMGVQASEDNANQKPEKLVPRISERHNLAMIYTCNVCQTRSAKTMSRETYEKGVVIVRCGGCKNLHLIADHLGWFGEPGTVEDFLKQKGIEVRKGSEETYEFSVEDLAGWTPNVKS